MRRDEAIVIIVQSIASSELTRARRARQGSAGERVEPWRNGIERDRP